MTPQLLKRSFVSDRPNEISLTDITYIPTEQGWPYLAIVLDFYSRRIVGCAMSNRMTSDLTIKAATMALRARQIGPGLTHTKSLYPIPLNEPVPP